MRCARRHNKNHEVYKAEAIERWVVRIKDGQKGILPTILAHSEKVTPMLYCPICNTTMAK